MSYRVEYQGREFVVPSVEWAERYAQDPAARVSSVPGWSEPSDPSA